VQQLVPAGGLALSYFHLGTPFRREKVLPAAIPHGCAEGRSPFAEGLGVSPNFLALPPRMGAKGVETRLLSDALMAVTGRRHGVFFRVDI